MKAYASPALWFLSRATGLRNQHVVAAAAAVTVLLVAMALPFWWLGEQADGVAGLFGILFVLFAYLSTATVVVVSAVVLAGRFALTRIRRTLRII